MSFYLRFTVSKVLAYLIAIGSAAYAFIYKDGTVMISGFSIAAGMFINKQYQDRKEFLKDTTIKYE